MPGTKHLEQKIDRLIQLEAQKKLKNIQKKGYIHWISLFKYFASVDTLSLLTLQYFDYVTMLRKKYKGLSVHHLFMLQYLSQPKVTFASQSEIRYFLKKSFVDVPTRTTLTPLLTNKLVERAILPKKVGKTYMVMVITSEGRKVAESLANKQILRNVLNNYKAIHNPMQRSIYGRKKAIIQRNPDLRLDKR